MLIFDQRKKDILNKKDKSFIGEWDEKIKPLCDKINKKENYYTTSSCSGRIVIVVDKDKKTPGVFEAVFHDLIDVEKFWRYLPKEQAKLDLKYKQEPCILHVACRGLTDAEDLLRKAQLAGWKRSGIIANKNNFVCELLSTEKLEFPLMKKGELIVNDNFLRLVIDKSNDNLKKVWKKINRLKKII